MTKLIINLYVSFGLVFTAAAVYIMTPEERERVLSSPLGWIAMAAIVMGWPAVIAITEKEKGDRDE